MKASLLPFGGFGSLVLQRTVKLLDKYPFVKGGLLFENKV